MGRPVVYVCGGSDCRQRQGARLKLLEAAGAAADVEPVRCQDVCTGPVAGLVVDGRLEWFRRVRGRKLRAAVVRAAVTGHVPGRLRDLRVKKRSGRLR